MKTLTMLALLLAATTLLACQGACGDDCGELNARCCGWEFYKPCDLIEGKRVEGAIDPCAPVAVEIAPCSPASAAAPEQAPPADAEAEAETGGN